MVFPLCCMKDDNKVFCFGALFWAPRVFGWVAGSKRMPARGGAGIQQMLTELEAEGGEYTVCALRHRPIRTTIVVCTTKSIITD